MEKPVLRIANVDDSEFAYCVRKAAFKPCIEMSEDWNEEEQRRQHERRFASHEFRIVSMGNADVGIVAMEAEEDCLKVNQMFLLPQHQGKGIGAACMQLIIEEAQRLSLPIRLRVLKTNPRALVFYQRQGFSVVGQTDSHDLLERYL